MNYGETNTSANSDPAARPWYRFMLWITLAGLVLLHILEAISLRGKIGSDFFVFYEAAQNVIRDPLQLYPADAKETLQGYLYPPPAALIFLPLVLTSLETSFYWANAVVLISAAAACAMWLQLLRLEAHLTRDRLSEFVIFLAALATGSMLAVRQGQVDTIILLLCVLPVWLDMRGWPRLAGAIIAAGCWIKIYPVLMLFWVFCRPEWRKLVFGFIIASVAIPLISLPILPTDLFIDYFYDKLPSMSGRAIINIDNQSLAAVLVRSFAPLSDFVRLYSTLPLPTWFRGGIVVAMLTGMAAIFWRVRHTGKPALLVASWAMAIACLVAPLGWGHTYCLLLPLLIHVMRISLERQDLGQCITVGLCYVALLVPAHHRLAFDTQIPIWAAQVFYARYAIAACVLLLLSWRQAGLAFSATSDRSPAIATPPSPMS